MLLHPLIGLFISEYTSISFVQGVITSIFIYRAVGLIILILALIFGGKEIWRKFMKKVLLLYPEFSPLSFWNYKDVCKLTGAKYPAAPLGMITLAALLPQEWMYLLTPLIYLDKIFKRVSFMKSYHCIDSLVCHRF